MVVMDSVRNDSTFVVINNNNLKRKSNIKCLGFINTLTINPKSYNVFMISFCLRSQGKLFS